MSREEMVKRCWKPYCEVEYKHPRMEEGLLCMLCSIHFDDEIVELQPYGDAYKKQSFYTSIDNLFIPKKGIRVASKNGKKINDGIEIKEAVEKQLPQWPHNNYFK